MKVEVCAHPVWQEDLVPLLNAGELIDCVEHIRIPYAAQLTNGAGIALLLAERPGSTDQYLLGSFATFDDNYADPHAPISIVLSSDAAHAASLATGTFLPAYKQAVHERLLAAFEAAHGRLEELHATWTAIQYSGCYSDGTRLDPATLGHTQQQYLEESSVEWRRLRPPLRCAPLPRAPCGGRRGLRLPGSAPPAPSPGRGGTVVASGAVLAPSLAARHSRDPPTVADRRARPPR
ncbi:hypothetical protein [Streptomyces virginiae]|uniref:hypothetical protein n=1 Tax=Streptomyces virginiae TaxID=1961 RepID=UPI0035E256A7